MFGLTYRDLESSRKIRESLKLLGIKIPVSAIYTKPNYRIYGDYSIDYFHRIHVYADKIRITKRTGGTLAAPEKFSCTITLMYSDLQLKNGVVYIHCDGMKRDEPLGNYHLLSIEYPHLLNLALLPSKTLMESLGINLNVPGY